MLLRSRWVVCCVIWLLAACGAEKPTEPMISDPSTLYHSLQLEHKAIIVSTFAPYDTVQLRVTPRNLLGDVIAYDGAVQFRRLNELDTSVRVDPDGLVNAQSTTSGTRVIASLTIEGITRADTATIMVRNEFPIQKIEKLEFFPLSPDSSWRWAGWRAAIGYERWVRFFGDGDAPIPQNQAVVAYRWDDDDVVSGALDRPYESAWGEIGETYIHASVYAYGKRISDSVLFSRVEPTVKFVVVDRIVPEQSEPSIVFFPGTLQVQPGTTVIFFNSIGVRNSGFARCTPTYFCGNRVLYTQVFPEGYELFWVDSVDIQFEDPENVLAGESYGNLQDYSVQGSFPSDQGVGNVDAFSIVRCETVSGASRACDGSSSVNRDPGYRSRKFTKPGTYKYTSSRFPGATGTIIVKER